MRRPFPISSLVLALAMASGSLAGEPAKGASSDPAPTGRVYFTEGGEVRQECRVETTETGAVVRCESRVVLKSRPMSAREEAMRLEWIRNLDLGDGKGSSLSPERRAFLERLLERTSPAGVVESSGEALRSAFDAWSSPLRFEAIWLDQVHPPTPAE